MDAGAYHGAALRDRAQRQRHERPDGREDDGGIERLRG